MATNEIGVSTHIVNGIKPEVHFDLFARYGFSLVELNLGYFPLLENAQKFKELQDLLVRNNIRVCSFHLPYGGTVPALGYMDISHPDPDVRRNTIDCIRLCLERLMTLNAHCLVLHPSSEPVARAEREKRLDFCVESLRMCLKIADELQSKNHPAAPVQIAIETLIPTVHLISDVSEVSVLFKRLNHAFLGLCLDVNHINLNGQDPMAFTREVGARVITTHLSDNDGVNERHWIPGRGVGVIPWKQWVATLLATGYRGPFLYESSQPEGVSDEETVAEIHRHAKELSAMV
ncbi:MAG: sugar phosphate isomerase/epimerase [Verrucomicrobia bacterium]|nr:sugar phosphate isomerase/epimerase [Verrucomicrobiota bacterium]MCG2681253.1 sugar phosphate isomerase/epimerase [Kiritimatiellia bacterium]MBU4246921.1 sugar phosphate isomerase/epimerase [Verrucomicrobiota bacterium]MBU4291589.1 sugar phosphate isomerase/epimerase [Verrucomicrobiota bacterium]MBU4428308.1 sugar phosphate isomerase/epimerase [Verrucomicrobiota bacterium]